MWWKAGGAAALLALCAWTFAAYLRPDMVVSFGDLMAFCASYLR